MEGSSLEIAGRVHIISLNVDELPDAGEKILRDLGLVVCLPPARGEKEPRYEIFAKRDTALVTVTPTGQAAIVMSGATRRRKGETDGIRDFERWFQSSLARVWTEERYVNQLSSIFAGDFLVENLDEKINSVSSRIPPETLKSIQECFVQPPVRYRLSLAEIRSNYERALDLTAKVIIGHVVGSKSLVRNRRMVAHLRFWKLTADHRYF